MGVLYMVNPPKRKSRKRRTAKQKAATRKMLAANRAKRNGTKKRRRTVKKAIRRRTTRSPIMARRKRSRKRATAKRVVRRRRRSSTKRRSPVTKLRRNSVYLTNRPRRRRRYSRNPAILALLKQGAMDAVATLAGGAAGRTVAGLLPLPKDGIAGAASSLAVALGIGIAARKVVSADTARFITAGAMQVPIKNIITTFVPQAGAFLGDYDGVGVYSVSPGDGGMGNYLNPGMYGYQDAQYNANEMGVYE